MVKCTRHAVATARSALLITLKGLPFTFSKDMQRTRLIDDAVLEFVERGGRQVLLLGAGYDCRAQRLTDRLADARVFEVDHPVTQARKRAVLGEPQSSTWLAWDFETRALEALPAALAAVQHSAAEPTLAIWEGVSMYLQEPAVDATVRALETLCATGSRLVFTYIDRERVHARGLLRRVRRRWLAAKGEPVVFGFDPQALPAWLAARGFELERDVSLAAAARTLLPGRHAALLDEHQQHHVAWARRVAGP